MSNSDIAAEARTLIAQQLYSDAIALLADHLDLSPNHTAAWELIAVAYSKLGDWQDALDAMEQVLADKSDSALAWSQYGMALRKTGDFSGARKAQVQALTIDPDLELGIIELRKIKRDQGGRHKKRRPTTYCPKCGYALAPTDAECPRCITRRNQARDLARDLATEQAAYAAPAMPTAPVFSEVAEAADGSQYIAKVPQQDPSMPAAPAVPTATPYVKNVPQPSAQFPQPPQIPMPDTSPYATDPDGIADAATAHTFSIIGLFFAGIVFGILAIVWANRAEARGVNASSQRTLGIADVVIHVILVLIFTSPALIATWTTLGANLSDSENASANPSANATNSNYTTNRTVQAPAAHPSSSAPDYGVSAEDRLRHLEYAAGAERRQREHEARVREQEAAERGRRRADGKIVYVMEDDAGSAIVMARAAVENQLKAPSTAKFSNERFTIVENPYCWVIGEVDAQNSFGAMLRKTYACKLQKISQTGSALEQWRCQYCLLDE